MKIKISLGQIFMESNHADKRKFSFQIMGCARSILSNYAQKDWKILTQFIEIRSHSIKVDAIIA